MFSTLHTQAEVNQSNNIHMKVPVIVLTYWVEIRSSKFKIQTNPDQSETFKSEENKKNSFRRKGVAYSVNLEVVEKSVCRYLMLWC